MPEEGMDRRIYLEAKFGSQDSYHRLEEQVVAAGASEGISFAFERMRKDAKYLFGASPHLVCRAARSTEFCRGRAVQSLF
jgi:predicted DsbA family dithiol-disulfide isomerase